VYRELKWIKVSLSTEEKRVLKRESQGEDPARNAEIAYGRASCKFLASIKKKKSINNSACLGGGHRDLRHRTCQRNKKSISNPTLCPVRGV